ncbi:MAG: methionine adenosyltransferase [Spirochaeta sp.]
MNTRPYLFTSESVSEGHPDKIADQISDAVLDACLQEDPHSHVACETYTTTGMVLVGGEITTETYVDIQEVARKVVKDIGYTHAEYGLDYQSMAVLNTIHNQSPDIAQGVDSNQLYEGRQGAGDQGMMFGYACTETEELMPAPIMFSHRILQRASELRKNGSIEFLRPDSKSQVTMAYEDGRPVRIHTVVLSHQHNDGIRYDELRERLIREVVKPVLEPTGLLDNDTIYHINPTGRFVIGGPHGDAGLTGRKVIVDTYGGMGRHGGGAFSGKDPSKVDRSAAYMARWVAKHIVAAGLATNCEVQLAYAIWVPDPVSIMVETFGTASVPEHRIEQAIPKIFDLSPAGIIRELDLLLPGYLRTAAYGHFGREGFSWETLERVEDLQREV